MNLNMKELSIKEEKFIGGHTLCPGCAEGIIVRAVMNSTDKQVVVATATGCLEVSTTRFPFTSWKTSWIHNAFENVGATISGVESAYVALKKKGKIKDDVKFVAFAGDGGTYDIGLQSLSGALERGHNFVFVCLDNEAYMNTGIQRSSATPFGAWTNTCQVGKAHTGKEQFKKDIMKIVEGHDIPYIAQASPSNWADLVKKANKAFETKGPAFLNVISPCVPGWKYPANMTLDLAKVAVETNFWPLYEIENGKFTLNYEPKQRLQITDWLKMQGRFKHLMKPENSNIVKQLQDHIDLKFDELKKKCECFKKNE